LASADPPVEESPAIESNPVTGAHLSSPVQRGAGASPSTASAGSVFDESLILNSALATTVQSASSTPSEPVTPINVVARDPSIKNPLAGQPLSPQDNSPTSLTWGSGHGIFPAHKSASFRDRVLRTTILDQ
jgi:hypothetical protein